MEEGETVPHTKCILQVTFLCPKTHLIKKSQRKTRNKVEVDLQFILKPPQFCSPVSRGEDRGGVSRQPISHPPPQYHTKAGRLGWAPPSFI